jgi:hypothetical protein
MSPDIIPDATPHLRSEGTLGSSQFPLDTSPTPSGFSGIIEIQDPEIDVQEILGQIREKMTHRKQTDFALQVSLAEDRIAVRDALIKLKLKIQNYGSIGEPGVGFKGKSVFLAKRIIRKLIKRHLQTEKEALEQTVQLIERLLPYLDEQTRQIAICLNRLDKVEASLK